MKVVDIVKELEKYGESLTEEDALKLEMIELEEIKMIDEDTYPLIEALSKLDNIKTILFSPIVCIKVENQNYITGLKSILDSGVNLDFIGKFGGGYLLFDIEYGVDDCTSSELRENTFPLCEKFSDLLDIYVNINKFIDDLDGEDIFGLFKKIEEDIYNECGAGDDMFLTVNNIFSQDEDYLIWEKN